MNPYHKKVFALFLGIILSGISQTSLSSDYDIKEARWLDKTAYPVLELTPISPNFRRVQFPSINGVPIFNSIPLDGQNTYDPPFSSLRKTLTIDAMVLWCLKQHEYEKEANCLNDSHKFNELGIYLLTPAGLAVYTNCGNDCTKFTRLKGDDAFAQKETEEKLRAELSKQFTAWSKQIQLTSYYTYSKQSLFDYKFDLQGFSRCYLESLERSSLLGLKQNGCLLKMQLDQPTYSYFQAFRPYYFPITIYRNADEAKTLLSMFEEKNQRGGRDYYLLAKFTIKPESHQKDKHYKSELVEVQQFADAQGKRKLDLF